MPRRSEARLQTEVGEMLTSQPPRRPEPPAGHDLTAGGERAAGLVEAVAHAAAAIAREQDLVAVGEAVVEQAVALGALTASLHLLEPGGGLRLLSHRHCSPEILARLEHVGPAAPLVAAVAARTRRLQVVERLDELDPALTATRDVLEKVGAHGLLSVPLVASGALLGVLSWSLRRGHRFSEAQIAAVQAVGEVVAVGLANAIARERLARETEQRERAEAAAREGMHRLRALFDHTFQFIGLLSREGTLLDANRSALELVGKHREEVVGRPFWDTPWWSHSAEQAVRVREAIAEAASGRFVRFEAEHIAADGRTVTVDFSLSPWRDEHGEVVLLVPEGRNIDDRKALERDRQEWVSVIAHDLRQPVNGASLWLQILERRVGDAPEARQPLQNARATVRQLDRMIRDLLDVSRLDANRLTLERAPTDLRALVESIVRSSPAELAARVRCGGEGELPLLDLDAGRIDQVLRNLLSNAEKYGTPATPIEIRVEARDGEAVVSVTNEGAGIEPENVGRLFQRFYRAPRATGDGVTGLGLGLYIARTLVERHGGRVSAESRPGETTTISFMLPITALPRPQAAGFITPSPAR